MAKHKTLGQVFTPDWIANEILDRVSYNDGNVLNKYVLEASNWRRRFLF